MPTASSPYEAELARLRARVQQFQSENAELRRRLDARDSLIEALRGKIAEQERKLKELRKRLKLLKKQGQRRDRRIKALKREVAALQSIDQLDGGRADRISALHQALAERERKIASLEEKIGELQQQGKRQAHPFRRNKRKPKSKHKKSGRRKGRGTFKRRDTPAEEQITAHLHSVLLDCPHCACTDLPEQKRERENFQIDLQPLRLEMTSFHSQWCRCPCCGRDIQSRHPWQLSTAPGAANITFGARILALAADLHEHHGLSYERIADLFSFLIEDDFKVERSSLCKALDRLTDSAEPVYAELIELLHSSPVVYADETGWRIGSLSAWLWVFCNERITVYDIRSGEGARGHEVVIDALGKEFRGVLASDGLIVYDAKALNSWLKQKCLGHLLQALAELRGASKGTVLAFTVDVISCLKDAINVAKNRDSVDEQAYATQCERVKQRMDSLLDHYGATLHNADAIRLHARLIKQRKHLFTFLDYPYVDPTNNRAERDLRPGVITRKTQGCNKVKKGARKHYVLASILSTLRKQGRDATDFLIRLMRPGEPTPSIAEGGLQADAEQHGAEAPEQTPDAAGRAADCADQPLATAGPVAPLPPSSDPIRNGDDFDPNPLPAGAAVNAVDPLPHAGDFPATCSTSPLVSVPAIASRHGTAPTPVDLSSTPRDGPTPPKRRLRGLGTGQRTGPAAAVPRAP